MGFLERLRASQNTGIEAWKQLTTIEQLEEIDQASFKHPIVLFKHSTTCGISAGAKHRLEMKWSDIIEELSFYYLDLLAFRSISNAIAHRYEVRHESPQVIVIKNGKTIYHTSHHKINAGDLNKALTLS